MGTSRAIINIGKVVTGRVHDPIAGPDVILVKDGKIAQMGHENEVDLSLVEEIIDVRGMIIAPGLIDAHVHPVIGDWQPRQKIVDWMEGTLHAGTTSLISQGIVHLPGRPRDPVGAKCLAIAAAKVMSSFRPGGALKAYFGTVVLEPGLTEEDFAEMSRHGVQLVAEIGAGSGIHAPEDVKPMVHWARKHGLKVCIHFGGAAAPGSATIGAAEVLAIQPDIVCHLNGGSTAAPREDILTIIHKTTLPFELVYNGNPRRLCEIITIMKATDQLSRILLGSDQPVGIGFSPAAILKTAVMISSLGGLPAEQALALGTGNTARVFGLAEGTVSVGKVADLIALDKPAGSEADDALGAIEIGDVPGVGMIMVDGQVVATRGRNTPQASRTISISECSRA